MTQIHWKAPLIGTLILLVILMASPVILAEKLPQASNPPWLEVDRLMYMEQVESVEPAGSAPAADIRPLVITLPGLKSTPIISSVELPGFKLKAVQSSYQLSNALILDRRVEDTGVAGLLNVILTLHNETGQPVSLDSNLVINLQLAQGFRGLEDPGAGFGALFYSGMQAFRSSESVEALQSDMLLDNQLMAADAWLGWTNTAYLIALRVPDNNWTLLYQPASESDGLMPEDLQISTTFKATQIEPGAQLTRGLQLLTSPRQRELLGQPEVQLEGLILMNFWNWFRSLCAGLWFVILQIKLFCGSWGLAIILLALLIRSVTIPITRVSLKYQKINVAQQAAMAPLLAQIKQKYKGVEQSEQIVALYDSVDYQQAAPFKAMLGLFIQIPILVALFNTLGEAFELRGQSFLWIDDLARSDRSLDLGLVIPYFGQYLNLLPLLMALVTAASTRLAMSKSQIAESSFLSLYGLALVFFVLFYSFPAGLVLYWMMSNFFQLLQQLLDKHRSP